MTPSEQNKTIVVPTNHSSDPYNNSPFTPSQDDPSNSDSNTKLIIICVTSVVAFGILVVAIVVVINKRRQLNYENWKFNQALVQ